MVQFTDMVIAGPCALECRDQALASARKLSALGVRIMRACIFKPRTSPRSFQGLGIEGLKLIDEIKKETGIMIETEVTDPRHVEEVSRHVDILRIGARNMQNYELIKEAGKTGLPVIIKRGMSSTLKELILSAEYVGDAANVILCERGLRHFDDSYRFLLDITAIPKLKQMCNYPIIVDPSHAAGDRTLIAPLSRAAVSAGADGLMIEVHPDPDNALVDGKQSLSFDEFADLYVELRDLWKSP